MGAWGTTNFENDQALDWASELLESDSLAPLEEAFLLVIGKPPSFIQRLFKSNHQTQYIDADIASNALAAAEVVAALHQHPCESLPEGLPEWVKQHTPLLSASLIDLANLAIDKIQTSSELADLWAESNEFENWTAVITNLKGRLA